MEQLKKRPPTYIELTNFLCTVIQRDGYSDKYDGKIKLLITNYPKKLEVSTYLKVLSLIIHMVIYHKEAGAEKYVSLMVIKTLDEIEVKHSKSPHLLLNDKKVSDDIYYTVEKSAKILDETYRYLKRQSMFRSFCLSILFGLFAYFVLKAPLPLALIESVVLFGIDFYLSLRKILRSYTDNMISKSKKQTHATILSYVQYFSE